MENTFPSELKPLYFDGEKLVTLTFEIKLYTNEPLSKHSKGVLYAYEEFLVLCPKEKLTFYKTATTRGMLPVNARALNMLNSWFDSNAREREFTSLVLQSGNNKFEAPDFQFSVWGTEPKYKHYAKSMANYISLSFPYEYGFSRSYEMLSLTMELCKVFPFTCGDAGFTFQCSPMDKNRSNEHALELSKKYKTIDIHQGQYMSRSVADDGIRNIGWLTILSNQFAKELGSIQNKISGLINLIDLGHGFILKCGDKPILTNHKNAPDIQSYHEVYKLLSPFIERVIPRSMSLEIDIDYVERTELWMRRLKVS